MGYITNPRSNLEAVLRLMVERKWPQFAETERPVIPGNTAYSLRGPMRVESIEINNNGWTLWGELDGERYIIDQGNDGDFATATAERAAEFMGEPDE